MSYYTPLSRRLSEYAASYLSPYIKLDDDGGCTDDTEGNDASFSASKRPTQSSLSVGLWSGNVELKNVDLRPDAIENFLNADYNNSTSKGSDNDVHDSDGSNIGGARVRWKLLRGSIESINIRIPWKSLVVGTSHSSSKRSSEKMPFSESEGGGGDVADCGQINSKQGEEEAEIVTDGCTVVTIEGARLQIGYEIIHEDPLLNKLQGCTNEKNDRDDQNSPEQDPHINPPLDDKRNKMRAERDRILQIAERRLLAGLDPFPPSLVAGLQSIIASSIQSGMKSESSNASSSSDLVPSTNGRGSYFARMEDYLSSTMRNIVWRTFDSFSLSIIHVHVSMVGCSHYDKDVEATLRNRIKERKQQEKEKQEQAQKQEASRERWGNFHQTTPKIRNATKRFRQDKMFSAFHKPAYFVPKELEIEANKTQQRSETGEDASWANEGEIEIGFLVDRFDVRPASLDETLGTEGESATSADISATSGKEQSALKHFRISNLGVFLRRSCKQFNGEDEPSFSNDLKNDDFVIDPMNVAASVRWYRSNPEAVEISVAETASTTLSPRKRSRGQSFTVSTDMTSESIGTCGAKRRGKRDKKPLTRLPQTYQLRKRSRRLELSVHFGHVRSSVSSRQLFLLDSVCSSLDRLKRGRPSATIRSAIQFDRELIKRMAEEGMPIIDWDERITKAIPSLRSSRNPKSPRTLPTVIASWWKYAYISVLHENKRRRMLLDRCSGINQQKATRNNLSWNLESKSNWDFENQSKIRKDYIELYLETQGASNYTAADVAAAKIRLEELEDQLSVERILLLKNVARAASVRRNDSESKSDCANSLDTSTSNGEYFFFPPNFGVASNKCGEERHSLEYLTLPNDIAGVVNSSTAPAQVESRRIAKSMTGTSDGDALSDLTELPRSTKTFFVSVKISGFSLALCNFGEVDERGSRVDSEEKFILPDDISALTGFSEADDASVGRIKAQQFPDERLPADNFVPSCQFWINSRRGLYYEPIMLMHIVGISVSGQNVDGDHSRVECEFAVGGLDVVTCASPSPKRIISLGQWPIEEQIGDDFICPLPVMSQPSESISIRGISSFGSGVGKKQSSSIFTQVSPTTAMVDWAGLERITVFVAESKDISKGTILSPFQDEALLCNAFAAKPHPSNLSLELECNKLSLAIPTLGGDSSDEEGQYVIATVESLSLKTGHLTAKANDEGHDTSESGMSVTVNDLSIYIFTGEIDPFAIETNSTALLQNPANIQFRIISNGGAKMPYESKTEITCTSQMNFLVSDYRLQALSRLVAMCSSYFSKNCEKSDGENELQRPTLPAIADSVLAETKLSIPSLAISLVSDDEGNNALQNSDSMRDKLEEIITNYLSQLSCLDFNDPSPISSECMTKLCLGRCCAVGLSKHDAQILLHTAESHFKDDIAVMRNWDEKSVSGRVEVVIANAVKKAVSKFDAMQVVHSSIWHPESKLVFFVKSLSVSQSRLFLASLLQCTSGEMCVQNKSATLLRIAPTSGDEINTFGSSNISVTFSIKNCHDEFASSDVYLELGHIDAVFLAEAYIDAAETLQSTTQCFRGTMKHANNTPVEDLCFNGNATSASILLADKFIPFLSCRLGDISIEKVSGPRSPFSKTVFLSESLAIECVSPYGAETYPDVITTYQSSDNNVFGPSALTIQMTSVQSAPSSEQARISITLDRVRVLVLYQFICELTQFVSSPKYGFGLLSQYLSNLDEKSKGENSSSTTPKMEIIVRNSSLVLPQESTSLDLIGIEVEELSISPCKVKKSWSIDQYSFSQRPGLNGDGLSSSSSSEGFFECMEVMKSPGITPSNNVDQHGEDRRIPRVRVQLKNARIFTAIIKHCKSVSNIHMPRWNACVEQTGRMQSEKRAFRACGVIDDSIASNIECRLWEEVTTMPLSLGLTMDWVPKLRLLIENTLCDEFIGAGFDMRMSQFYLLMSMWYNNMTELPLMFPYDAEQIQTLSIDPEPPLDWPEYGSKDFIERIKHGSACIKFEMAICVSSISWRCSFDQTNYFGEGIDPETFPIMEPSAYGVNGKAAIVLELENALCNIKTTEETLLCVGLGATSLNLTDERCPEGLWQGIRTKNSYHRESRMDFNWGLDCGRHTLVDGLPLPVQATVFMTPDYYCMINLGLDMAEAATSDLGAIWILLDYFGLYFKDPNYGHPAFAAEKMAENHAMNVTQSPCLDIDFRLWLTDPHVIIPTSSKIDATCLMLESAGLQYRYKSLGLNFSSQDILAKDLGIVVLSTYIEADLSRGIRQVSGSLSSSGAKTLVDGLSFSVKYEYDDRSKFTRFAVRVPLSSQYFNRNAMDGIEPFDLDAKPFIVPPPLICNPLVLPSRKFGENETTVYFSYEYMKLAVELLVAFVGPNLNRIDEATEIEMEEPTGTSSSDDIFSVTAHLESIKFVVSDPIMGMHRPFFSLSIPSLLLTASRLTEIERAKRKHDKFLGRDDAVLSNSSNDKDLQACMDATIFLDYFKLGITRNWEPLVEPFRCMTMYEQSTTRGKGIIFDAGCPLHLNITGASIDTIDDAIDTFDLFFLEKNNENAARSDVPSSRIIPQTTIATTVSRDESGHTLTVLHKSPETLTEHERIAFSLKNFSGQRIRVHTQSDLEAELSSSKTTVMYLDHNQLMPVSFPATETVIKNLAPVEVPVKGDQNITAHKKQFVVPRNHSIDIQVPGFKWARDISLDKMGKHFIELVPRSPFVQAKANADWRLKNALNILAEVNSVNGGRRLCVTSPFEVVNKTDHSIFIAVNPDPRYLPKEKTLESKQIDLQDSAGGNIINDDVQKLDPDESYNIPYLLLESAMHLEGNHLGSIWVRPDQDSCEEADELSGAAKYRSSRYFSDTDTVGYPPRPIQLAKILHESSVIFKDSNGDPSLANQVASGAEISCPILDSNKKRKATPFCYVVEVNRSPLISSETTDDKVTDIASASSPPMGKGLRGARTIFSKTSIQSRVTSHAPVAYSLVIHPPIVIENLLPERGRFELMNATNKAVLWYGILEPGERFPIHTVGLDAPLMLLVNLGFCRTPVGEGALIHDGEGDGFWLKSGWRNVGSAISDTQDKVKKTLSSITKSKDNRGVERVTKLRQQSHPRETKKRRQSPRSSTTNALGDEVENERSTNQNMADTKLRDTFCAEDIATETTVVDSVGQRLTLLLDNVFGNGGQRHVTIYSPFWIVNTTEHSLRYKQEKALSYVSGTVWRDGKDGSKPVDGSNRNEKDDNFGVSSTRIGAGLNMLKLNTVFSGTHGALKKLEEIDNEASKPAILAALISEDLPLSITSKLAFMFNFQVSSLAGSPRMCIQLDDKTNTSSYTSAWSSGFGLESVGVTQIVGMLCKDGRGLEVMVSISVAPGRLSSYTKIVRICPRYVVVNQLPQSIRLWQDNSLLHSNQVTESSDVPFESRKWIFVDDSEKINQYEPLFGAPTMIDSTKERGLQTNAHHSSRYIASIRPSELIAFHLPDTRLERLLRVDVGSGWNLSSSFPDTPGQHVLSMDRARDIQALPHVSTRAAPYYNVVLPPPDGGWNGELGVWFETDWGKDRAIIVKGTRDGSYASHFTDIVVGDELVSIDDVPIKQLSFAEAMKLLKARLSYAQELNESEAGQPLQQRLNMSLHRKKKIKKTSSDLTAAKKESVTLTFVTLEEKMRRLRSAAASTEANTKHTRHLQIKGPNDSDSISAGIIEGNIVPGQSDINILPHESSRVILVDTNFLYQTILVNVKEPDLSDPLHKIINRSSSWDIYYRQRACDSHPWKCLSPGESASYTWEEPTKPKKLSVRVGPREWDGKNNYRTAGTNERKKRRSMFSVHFIENEEQGHFGATKTVKLEEIGYMDKLPCPAKVEEGKLSTDGLDGGLHCYVDTEGATRVLVVSDEVTQSLGGDEPLLVSHLTNIKKQLREENNTRAMINLIKASISDTGDENAELIDDSVDKKDFLSKLNDIVDHDEGLFITEPNQVIVEVLEAAGLQSVHLSGLSNPYCQVSLIEGRKRMRSCSFGSKVQSRSTYYVEKTVNPQWSRQAFVFDVPSKAANDPRETRRFSIHCEVRSEEKFGPNKFLGQAHVHLRNLEDQQECVGWYPLMGKVGKNEDSVDRIRGAVRLRVHWVFDYPGLLNYYSLCSDRRIETLQKSKAGMKRQLKTLREDEKQRKETRESLSLSKVPALAATMYTKKKSQLMETSGDRRKSVVIKRIKRVVNAKSALAQFRLSKQDRGQSDLSASNGNDFELDEIKEECASDNSDDSVESLQRIPSSFSGLSSPLNEVRVLGSVESENNGLLDLSAENEYLSGSLPKGSLATHRLQYLRHCSRERKSKHTVQIYGSPVFASLHISRAFINARDDKIREKPVKLSPIIVGDNDGIDEDNKYLHIIDHLRLPPSAPLAVSKRSQQHIRDLMHSRTSFSKAARRSLGSVLNPGGVLIIRPITALNLPETYTSMFVKLRCGNKMCQTNKADSTVAPVWSDEEAVDLSTISNTREYSQLSVRHLFERQDSYNESDNDLNEIAEWFTPTRYWGTPKQNDLILNVDAFETSKSLHLTVIGEKLQTKEVIGVLEIPLERAIECCSQSIEDFQESLNEGNVCELTPAYVRWFPLKSSALAVPVEGDMGQSTRPPDSEKVNDNMFEEYFAPCIKLALLFQPNQTERTNTDQYIFTRLDRISAAVIDSSRFNELLSFSSRDVDIRISVTKAKTRTSLTVGNVQIDQQSSNFRHKAPVIFAPRPTKYPNPTVQFLCWKDNIRSKSDMDSYDYVALRLEEMDLKIEEMWLFEIWDFYFHVMKKREARALARQKIVHTRSSRRFEEDGDLDRAIQNATSFLQVDREVKRLKKIYVSKLLFGYTKINLSYFKSAKGNLSSTDTTEDMIHGSENQDAFRQWSENTDGDVDERSHFAHVNMISTVFPSISDAPIKFQGKVIEHVFEYEGDISKYLLSFYASEALRQIYKIVGSLDFVGNPTMVVSSFSAGLRDFVLQPSRELKHLTKNPSRFGVGVLRGTLSLVSNSASGVFGLFSNLGSSFGATAAILTLDKEFQNLHSEQQAAQQRNYDRLRQRGFGRVTLLVTRPVHDVVFGLVSASTGIITEPYRGAKKEGIKGFAKGAGVGVIGVLVKPIVGLSDAFAHVMESVHDLAKDINVLEYKYRSTEKYRLPYVFGVERILVPFSQVDSISAALLKAHPVDKKSDVKGDDEVIVTSEALQISSGLDQYVIVTTKRVVLFKVKVSDGQGFATVHLVWQALLGEGARITSSLGDRGHNSSILCISRFYSDYPNDDVHSTFDEIEEVDQNGIPSRMRSVRSETSRQYSGVPFRRRARPFGSNESVAVNRYIVDGEFKQRPNLISIHNAICCLAGDFDATIDEGYSSCRGNGVTVFGPLLFEDEPNAPDKANLAQLYKSLEHAAWECYSREGQQDAPSWLDGAPPRTLSILGEDHVSHRQEENISEFFSNSVDVNEANCLEGGGTSFNAELDIGNPQRDSLNRASPFNLNDLFIDNDTGIENDDITAELTGKKCILERRKEFEGTSRSDSIFQSARSHYNVFDEREQLIGTPSIEAISLRSWTTSPSATGEQTDGPQELGLNERLSRVETALERLSQNGSIVSGSIATKPLSLVGNTLSISHSDIEYPMHSNFDVTSTTSSIERLSNRDAEVESLQREILSLKQQLNSKKLETVVEGNTQEGLSGSMSSYPQRRTKPKLKERMKQLIGKKKSPNSHV